MSASAVLADARKLFAGEPVFLTGSLVAADEHGLQDAWSDVDLFCPSPQVLIAQGQRLLGLGFKFGDRFERVWARWMRYGFNHWHTNSLKMFDSSGIEYNLVYKLTDGHQATSLAEVLESFDFGLLGVGYDMELDVRRDMRPYLFPNLCTGGMIPPALPMMPNKRMNWRNGFISQYNGLREAGRYAKYAGYGYELDLVKDDLSEGYFAAASYMSTHFDDEKKLLGKIYQSIGDHIMFDNIQQLTDASKKIDYSDELDVIMAALD